jgi:acyl-CoA thioesterase YciA
MSKSFASLRSWRLCVKKMENETTRDAAIRLTMMPRDTNAHGTVFGGIIMSYIDVAGGVEAVRHTRHNRFVTVAMKEVIFHEPVFIGDLVSFYARTLRVGSTSITIHVDVEAERFGTPGVVVRVTEAEVTFVAIDEDRNKFLIGDTPNKLRGGR